MLVLSRKLNQEITIGDNVTITVLKVKGNTVRLGIDAPRHVRITRGELPREPEQPSAEVTVVFDDPAQSADSDAVELLPFNSPRQGTGSIRYQTRVPQALTHSRLKAIVAELGERQG